jgi:hypothetical protein
MATCAGPGAEDAFDPWDLEDIMSRVVQPVLAALFQPHELGEAKVGWGDRLEASMTDSDLWVRVEAGGEVWCVPVWWGDQSALDDTLGEIAWRLADQLEDWISEFVYWGERRLADVVIPSRGNASGPSG